jgi:hypothetical protein
MIVYGLIDPRNGELRYVGKTARRPSRRLAEHAWASSLGDTHRCRWVRQVLSAGCKPEMVTIETHESANSLNDAEVFYISYFRYLGCDLTNATDGGEGSLGHKMSGETRKKMSKAKKGRPSNRAGKPTSAETRALQSAAHKGRPSPLRGRPSAMSPEVRARVHAAVAASHRVPVVDSDGRVYASMKDAAAALGVTQSAVGNSMRLCRPCCGLTFHRLKD